MIYCPYEDSTRDIQSNKALHIWDFPWALPSGTLSCGGLYLTVYPLSRPNTYTIEVFSASLEEEEFNVVCLKTKS